MSDRPILFSAPMVRALPDGRKTQTRRVLKVQPDKHMRFSALNYRTAIFRNVANGHRQDVILPYAPGDRLWVREQCATWGRGPEREPVEFPVVYAADDPEWEGIKHDAKMSKGDEWKIRPSIHMPRWASRLTLTVTEVRVQRLQEISEADAVAEGIEHDQDRSRGNVIGWRDYLDRGGKCGTVRGSFKSLWNSIHGDGAWDANPWVAAITFTVRKGNIDEATQ